jgi:hypothetical protein
MIFEVEIWFLSAYGEGMHTCMNTFRLTGKPNLSLQVHWLPVLGSDLQICLTLILGSGYCQGTKLWTPLQAAKYYKTS